jgi:5-keto 4-deoxyuronate isomerase
VPDQATLTYSQIDRIIVGGIHPVTQAVRFAPSWASTPAPTSSCSAASWA